MMTPRLFKQLGRLGLAALTLASASLLADDTSPQAREHWHQAIEQRYGALNDASERLEASAERFCNEASDSHRQRLTRDWLEAWQAWQAVRFVDFGPIEQNSRAWQMQFWPDRKNLVGRKMQAWLAREEAPTAEQIAEDSVAAQGFPALEYLLFDDSMQGTDALAQPVACGLMSAIATHLADTAGALQRDWQRFGDHYRGTQSYTTATLHGALLALETLETKRLGEPMGLTGGSANGYLAEAWRSERSVRLIEASLRGLEDTFLPGLRTLLNARGKPDLAAEFGAGLDKARQGAAEMAAGVAPALDDRDRFRALQGLYVQVGQLRHRLETIGHELGMVRGFNSSDGD
ncbi:imelysin family protein [Halomonas sabkhae]|uniref:imelysin family protein n=1 Tax=Halomonas sabkhae TaxID=626223 RepID=UPI0025B53A25|nr:imelysin family protein [Halomonas sabkhae]MDN3526575.1 imelysin family protein [Halomonas sabkhae]